MQEISNQLLYNLMHLYLWRSLEGGLWLCILDLCSQDTGASNWKNNKLLICPLERQHSISAVFMYSVVLGSLE